ncbi:MAG: CPBP family intramembrane metalloprotease [Anaerolineae bacterium]|nr:CPBP family intramembrane metalloprotease [Anaerolineae bacterium]
MREQRSQLTVFAVLLCANALLAFLAYALGLLQGLPEGQELSPSLANVPAWVLGLANAGIILVLYGLLGLAGLWCARKLELPGVYREGAGWRRWVGRPMLLGLIVGGVISLADLAFSTARDWDGFSHPPFPMSLIASATAGIGEEILYRAFVMSLWAFLWNLLLRRWRLTGLAIWIGNVAGALVFAAAHLPAAMFLLGASTLAELPRAVLAELLLLNGLLGLVAGERYARDGLVAAVGVHFWADIAWHVIWPLFAR